MEILIIMYGKEEMADNEIFNEIETKLEEPDDLQIILEKLIRAAVRAIRNCIRSIAHKKEE